MHKSSFLEIMRALDKSELKRFEAFLNSPYFNTRNNVVKLFNVIKKYAPEFEDISIDKENIWKKMFPGKEYNYGTFKNVVHDITKLAERFLEVEDLNSNELQRMLNLLKKLSDKHLDSIFINKFNFIEKNYFLSSKYYNEYFGDLKDFRKIRNNMQAFNPKHRTKLSNTNLSELMIFEFITNFGISFNNLYIEEAELNQVPDNNFIKLFSRVVFDNPELAKCADLLASGNDKNFRIINIFFKMMKSYLNPKSIDFYVDFKKTLFENDKYISESAMRRLYASLGSALDNCEDILNISVRKQLYDIIFHLVEKNIFLSDNGKVIPSLYLLAVKISGYLKETGFLETLIKEFLHKSLPELQENFRIYSLAYLHYSKNEYDKALEYSNLITIDSFQMKYSLRNLQIIISYEKNDYVMFQYLSDSHRHFLTKNKSVAVGYRDANMNFVNNTNALFKLRESNDRNGIIFLKDSISAEKVVNKEWLLDKLEELKNSFG